MGKQHFPNCSECAYAQKSSQGIWCPFHDEQVGPNLVCDNFLDECSSPLYASLAEGANTRLPLQIIIKDILGYIIILGLLLVAIVCTYGVLTQ